MSDREKKLAVAVGLLVALWLGNWGWQKYSDAHQAATTKKANAELAVQDALFEQTKTRAAVRKLREWRDKSLPANAAVAQSDYRAWLVERLQAAKLDVGDVSPRRGSQQSGAYQALGYEVEASGNLDSVVRFLDAFYRSDQLHKMTRLQLTPQSDGDRLRVTLNIEALVVNGTKREDGLSDGVSDRLQLASADEYSERIVSRNPFVAYEPPPPPRPKVVEKPKPKPPAPPKFNHADQALLTAVVSVGDDFQAWVNAKTLDEVFRVRKGDELKIGLFEGTVVDVYKDEMVVETDQGVLAFRVGDKLTDGRQLTSVPAGS